MGEQNTLSKAFRARVAEEAELTAMMLGLLPPGTEEWKPPYGGHSCSRLRVHLADTMSGFCAALGARRDEFNGDEDFEAFHRDALVRMDLLKDTDLERIIPTVFAPEGEPLATLLLTNLAHLINHKHQLFTYLKQLGVPVTSRNLYRFREPA